MKATPRQLASMRERSRLWRIERRKNKHVCGWCGYLVDGTQPLHIQCEEAKTKILHDNRQDRKTLKGRRL